MFTSKRMDSANRWSVIKAGLVLSIACWFNWLTCQWYSVQIWPGFLLFSGHPPSRAPARPAAWRAAPWPAPCRWAPTCRTASAASPTRPGWSASRADTSTATPVAIRSSTWPSKISRACLTTPAPCASPSASLEASARPPPGTSTGPTASCSSSSSQGRSTGVGGVEAEACRDADCRLMVGPLVSSLMSWLVFNALPLPW